MTLLEAALAAPSVRREPDPETVDLALAYYHGQVTDRQVAEALKCSPSNAASILSRTLKWAVQAGTLTLEKTK
jgi:hypothetical protein